MMFAAWLTTYSLAETEICRFSEPFRLSSAAYIDWVKARSFVALGAMSATFSMLTCGVTECERTVVAEAPLAKAAVPSAMPAAASTRAALLTRFLCIYFLSLLTRYLTALFLVFELRECVQFPPDLSRCITLLSRRASRGRSAA